MNTEDIATIEVYGTEAEFYSEYLEPITQEGGDE
jgi:hypothetical protein